MSVDIFRISRPLLAIAMHHLVIEPKRHTVNQAPRHMHLDSVTIGEAAVDKLGKASFITKVQYPVWLKHGAN